jgi:hypothetical protein
MNSPSLDTAYVNLLLGWDALEKTLGADPVIDFNLLDLDGGDAYTSRWEVLHALTALRKRAEREANPLAYRRLGAHEAFLRNRMGERWAFEPYIAATQGFRFKPYDEVYLERRRADLADRLALFGIRFDAHAEKAVEAADVEIPEAELAAFYTDLMARRKPELEHLLGVKADFQLEVSFADVDQYWAAWVDGRGKNFRLRFNRHTVKQHWRARSTVLALHELLAHLVKASLLVDSIQKGDLPPWLGLTTVHGPEMFQDEGLAQTLPLFWPIPEATDPLVRLRCAMSHYHGLVWHNAHIRLHGGTPVELVVDEVLRWQPWRDPHKVAHGLNSLGNHPLFRSYEFVYGASQDFLTCLAEQTPQDKHPHLLRHLYTRWMTYDDMVALRQQVAA